MSFLVLSVNNYKFNGKLCSRNVNEFSDILITHKRKTVQYPFQKNHHCNVFDITRKYLTILAKVHILI